MSISIREVDFDTDRSVLIDLLKRNRRLPASYPYAERYDWLYLDNPHGIATGWMVVDDETREPVGFTVALPREMSVSGKRVIAWNCADFSIDIKYRTLGVAAKLRRAAREAVDAELYPFLYAHPNERMLVVHQRAGHTVIGQMHRYARLLNASGKVESLIIYRPLSQMISATINPALDCFDRYQLFRHRYDIEMYDRLWYTEEFTEFYNRLETNYLIWGVRSATYLNWRYYHNPIYHVGTTVARKHGQISAYIIYRLTDDEQSVIINDIVTSSPDAIREMIAQMSIHFRKRLNWETIWIALPEWHPYLPIFKRLGFLKRSDSTSSIVVHASPNSELKASVLAPACWFVTLGDRDE
ncbi:hypothetical protein HYR99_33680 [Candidatus Poribacteria bacterium]|nr:hypothetical protein [Candidatus Poribacteria bacterium]